jgi:hypothetical protein
MLLQRRIELYLRRTRTAPSRFGDEVLNDRRFVFDLRRGRMVRPDTAVRVHAWLDRQGSKR